MKRILIIAFFLISLLPLFAATTSFYSPKDAQFLIDLGSDVYYSHTSSSSGFNKTSFAEGTAKSTSSKNQYYNNQIIGVYGAQGVSRNNKVTFTITTGENGWYYVDSDGNKRPFGIDLILKTDHEDYYNYNDAGPVIHMGLQESSDGTTVDSGKEITISYPTNGSMSEAWIDICLVLPTTYDNQATVKASENLFTSKITVTVASGSMNDTQTIDLTGMFSVSAKENNGLSAIVNVVPTATGSNLDIVGLDKATSVARYTFMTEYKNTSDISYEDKKAYLFLSSSSTGTTSGEKFKLRRVRSDGNTSTTDNDYNSVTFEAYLSDSATSTTYGPFDGTAKYSNSSGGVSNTTSVPSSSLEVLPDTLVTDNEDDSFVRWSSEGYILVKITGDTSNLLAGDYTSTIYVHVISPN